MLDIKRIRENPELVKENLRLRGRPELELWVEDAVAKDAQIRALKPRLDELRRLSNEISQQINAAKKAGKPVEQLIQRASSLPGQISALEAEIKELQTGLRAHLLALPNLLHPDVPKGQNKVLRQWGEPRQIKGLAHGEILERAGLADFARAAKIAGAGFYFLKGKAALLELSLQRFAVDLLAAKGFVPVQVPLMLRKQPYQGVVPLEAFENMMYAVAGEDGYLIATSEHPLIAQYMGEAIPEQKLPIRLCGVSACFRREIGSHGVDTRGLFRVHQFNKIEQAVISAPEDSEDLHAELQANAEEIFKALGIPHRTVLLCAEETGPTAAKQYDIEAWFPFQGKWAEVTSCSNCTDYQAVALGIKVLRKGGKREFVHTLNSTAVATSRTIAALIENGFKNGRIEIPKPLQPYCGFDVL